MISDEVRKRVAANLRQYLKKYETPDWRAFCNIILGSGRLDNLRKAQAFDRLADLIDRPTCTVESKGEMNPWEEYEMKLSCGDAVVWPADQSLPRYCPWCGARVVSGNE